MIHVFQRSKELRFVHSESVEEVYPTFSAPGWQYIGTITPDRSPEPIDTLYTYIDRHHPHYFTVLVTVAVLLYTVLLITFLSIDHWEDWWKLSLLTGGSLIGLAGTELCQVLKWAEEHRSIESKAGGRPATV